MNKVLKIGLYIVICLLCFGLGYGISYMVIKNTTVKKPATKVITTKKVDKASKEEKELGKVLTNEVKFNAARWDEKEVKEYYLKDYVPIVYEGHGYKIGKYTYMDLDGNGTKELVVIGDETYNGELLDEYNLVFTYDSGVINCYTFFWKEFSTLKADGTFYIKYASTVNGLVKVTKFNKITDEAFEKIEVKSLALEDRDGENATYQIGDKDVTAAEYEKYKEEFMNKKEPEWKEYK